MSSRQDQLHSYQYSQQRVVAALVSHDPDPSRSPFRRVGSTALVSVLVALVALGGTAAYAAIVNRGTLDADKGGAVYIEKETGAQFVLYTDGKLHPVLNYSSALLILGKPGAPTKRLSRKTLAKVPRGVLMGIAGAPDALPGKDNLTSAPWAVCTQQQPTGTAQSTLVIGDPIKGGTPATTGALLVKDPTETIFLVYGNQKFRIPDLLTVRRAFIWPTEQPIAVAAAWLNALPEGSPLAPLAFADRGEPADVPQIPGLHVGDLIKAEDGGGGAPAWKVATADGAADISAAQAALLETVHEKGATRTVAFDEFVGLKAAASGQAKVNKAVVGHPTTAPVLVSSTNPASGSTPQRLCLSVNPKGGTTTVLVDPEAPVEGNLATGSGAARVDRVSVHSGAGVLVEAVASPTAAVGSGALSIVTDEGRRYPIADAAAKDSLGFQGVVPQRIPAGLVALLPVGPALDPKLAVDPKQAQQTSTQG